MREVWAHSQQTLRRRCSFRCGDDTRDHLARRALRIYHSGVPLNKSLRLTVSAVLLSGCDVALEKDYNTLANLFGTSRADLEYDPEFIPPEGCYSPTDDIDPRRSLIMTEIATLDFYVPFTLSRVLFNIARSGGEANLGEFGLFYLLWTSQTPGPDPVGFPHCSDNGGTLNGFPNSCFDEYPPELLYLSLQSAVLLAAVNRFDLTDGGQTHCGEARLIFMVQSPEGATRTFINFEARIPNPTPGCIQGCRELQSQWQAMSFCSADIRARLLENIFFNGSGRTPPALRAEHFAGGVGTYGGSAPSGQIRMLKFNRYDPTSPPVMKEMTLQRVNGRLVVQPRAVTGNPFGDLFSAANTSPVALDFRAPATSGGFLASVDELAINDLARFGLDPRTESRFFAAESPVSPENDYLAKFREAPHSAFGNNIAARLPVQTCIPSVENILARATAMSCAGCHGLSNNQDLGCGLTWPSAIGFLHVDPNSGDVSSDGMQRYGISPALISTFLPPREQFLENFLRSSGNCTTGRGRPVVEPLMGMRIH